MANILAQRGPARMKGAVRSLPTLSLHLLAAIAEEPVSVVGLASRTGQLKGTVSKHVQRLVEAGLVVRVPIPGNRKEIELR
jgi:DNA-binding MarR family transcriptional regulator